MEQTHVKLENGEIDATIGSSDNIYIDPYEKKYYALLRRCESIQQSNEQMQNRLSHVKKLLRRTRRERRFLMKRLDLYGDNYRNVPLTFSVEDDNEDSVKIKTEKTDTPENIKVIVDEPIETKYSIQENKTNDGSMSDSLTQSQDSVSSETG